MTTVLAATSDRLAVNSESYATSRRVMSAIRDALSFGVASGDSLIQIFESSWTAGLLRAWTRQLYLIWRRNTLRMRSKFRYELWRGSDGYVQLIAEGER